MSLKDKEMKQKQFGVIGNPVAHSLSPKMFNYWFSECNIDANYALLPCEKDFENFVITLIEKGFSGVNVTIPYKNQAFQMADECDEASIQAKAANILSFEQGKVKAYNSDHIGFIDGLKKFTDLSKIKEKETLIIGAGGAASAILYGLIQSGFANITICNRTLSKAEELIHTLKCSSKIKPYDKLQESTDSAEIIINTTSMGMKGNNDLDIELKASSHQKIIYDIVYNPLDTKLLQQGKKHNFVTINGLYMLMFQAAFAYETWLGKQPNVDEGLYSLLKESL